MLHAHKTINGFRWTIEPEWLDAITGPDAPNWRDLKSDPAAQCVKSNPRRRVYRLTLGQHTIYAKEYRPAALRDRLRRHLRGPEANLEWTAAHAVIAAGVATVRPLALGISRRRSLLLTEALTGQTLDEAWSMHPNCPAIIKSVAHFIADAHNKGVLHGDDHPANILVTISDTAPKCHYLDIQTARVLKTVTDPQAARSLAQLHQWFWSRTTLRLRLRFLRHYCQFRAPDHPRDLLRRIIPMIEAESHAQAAVLWEKRDARILKTNRHFAKLPETDHRGPAHVVLRPRHPEHLPQAPFTEATTMQWHNWLSGNDVSEMTKLSPPADAGPRSRDPLLDMFITGNRLLHRDIPTRRPLAYAAARNRNAPATLYLSAVPEATHWIDALREEPTDRRKRAVTALATLIAQMSDRGVACKLAESDTFSLCQRIGTQIAFVNDVDNVTWRLRDPHRDRESTTLALFRALQSRNLYRRRDAVRFLKVLHGRRWKAAFTDLARHCEP